MPTTWDIKIKGFKKLKKNINTDVLIVGGGLAGVWHAYLLAKSNKKVIVVEKDKFGKGATFATTGFLNEEIDTNLSDLISMFGKRIAKDIWLSHEKGIEMVESVVEKENIDCEFERSPLLVYANDENEFKILQKEEKAAKILGFKTVLKRKSNLSFKNCGYWEIRNQAKYHPMKFLNGLLESAEKIGVEFYEQSEVVGIEGKGPLRVELKNGSIIKTHQVVIATYEPFNNESTHFKKGMYLSYVLEGRISKGKVPYGMYLDMKDPYNYFRIDKLKPKKDRIIFGGADHRKEIKISPNKNFQALEETIKKIFGARTVQVVNKWRGPILEPTDGLALIGKITNNQFVASAFSGNGMTYSPLSALINTSLILGKPNRWGKLYDPKRTLKLKPLIQKAEDYTMEFVGGALKNIFK